MRSIRVIGIVLIVCVVLLIATYLLREGYEDDGGAYKRQKEVNDKLQGDFVENRRKAYNSIGMALTTAGTQGNLGNNTAPTMGTFSKDGTIGAGDKYGNIPLDTKATGLFDLVKICEVVNTTDCSAFDDPKFSANCGMCLDPGPPGGLALNSDNEAAVGGRVLLTDERIQAESGVAGYDRKNTKVSIGILPDYIPTLGSCPVPKRMASNKAQCLRIKREMACQKNANYDQANCNQCFGDGNYSIVDPTITPNVFTGAGTLVIFGEGVLNFTEGAYQAKPKAILSKSNALRIKLRGPEMTRLSFKVDPVDEDSPQTFIAGYLTGLTASGDFTIDLIRIILNDSVTGRKPLTGGSMTADGMQLIKMIAGFGQTTISLQGVTPFTFVDPYTMEAATCSSSPYVTTQAAAEFLSTDPCYKKGSGPGKYSLECLQNIFLSNGGLQTGKGYPKDSKTAGVLMLNNGIPTPQDSQGNINPTYDVENIIYEFSSKSNGRPRSLDEIANLIYSIAIISATGISVTGEKQTLVKWSAASVFCTGKEILTPCDTYGKDTGPLSEECLAYLWDNMGSLNSLGGTYSGISLAKSLFNSGNSNQNARFCQRSGTMSPIDMNGKKNPVALAYWKKQGGVSAVKAAMKTIHDMANNEDYLTDEDRGPYISQCYGEIPMAPRPGPVKASDSDACPYPNGTDKKGLCTKIPLPTWPPAPRTPVYPTIISELHRPSGDHILTRSLVMKKDFRVSFEVTPERIPGGHGYLLHFTSRPGGNCCGIADRILTFIFLPGTLDILVQSASASSGQWALVLKGLALKQQSSIVIDCIGDTIKATLDGKTNTYSGKASWVDANRYTGPLVVYSAPPFGEVAGCLIENLSFQTSD